jgi:hypothetical protein
VGLKLNGTSAAVVGYKVNLLGDNIDTITKNTETLIDASEEVGLQVNTEKTKYVLVFFHQNAGQNHDIIIANRRSENVAQFKELGYESYKLNFDSGGISEEIEFG